MVAHIGGKIMAKFKVGDRVRKINDEFLAAFSIGEELFVTGTSCIGNYWVGKNLGEEIDTAYESDLELIEATPKEITLNGATYVLKEDPKPEHEWKFGDIAMHDDYGVGMVFSKPDYENDVRFAYNDDWDWADIKDLTFLRRADLSV